MIGLRIVSRNVGGAVNRRILPGLNRFAHSLAINDLAEDGSGAIRAYHLGRFIFLVDVDALI